MVIPTYSARTMNILPIPALDGGHVVFLLYEMITRRKPSEKFMVRAEYVGITILSRDRKNVHEGKHDTQEGCH